MKTRCLCLILDISPKEAKNKKSYLSVLQGIFSEAITKLEPGDALLLYEKTGIEAYDEQGTMLAAVANYKLHDFELSKAMKEMVEVVHAVPNDEEIYFFVITDHYKKSSRMKRALEREPGQNIYGKPTQVHLWGINTPDLLEFEAKVVDDPGEIKINIS